jgi:hypothetical protein
LVCSTPSITLPHPFTSHPPFFSSFRYTSLCPPPSQLKLCNITDALAFSLPFPLSPSSVEQFHCYTHALRMSLYMVMMFLCMCLSLALSSTYERKHVAFVFLILAYLTWCPPVASMYYHTTCHYSSWLSKTPLCILHNFMILHQM